LLVPLPYCKYTLIKPNLNSRIILGVDPGTILTGYGIIHVHGNSIEVLAFGAIQLGRQKTDNPAKLKIIFDRLAGLINEFKVQELSIEAPFFGKNIQSMLKLGRAQGVAMAAALSYGLEIHEYAPRKIKQAITGNGNAGKEQVHKMLETILNIKIDEKFLDASDGLAAAVCHHFQKGVRATGSGGKKISSGKKSGSWDQFLKNNPDRLKKS
jgi:crossover junction endodeoxyribonuclease RuvC